MLELHIHMSSQTVKTWTRWRILSENKREDTYVQIRKRFAMHHQDEGRGEHDWMKSGRRAVYNTGQGWALISKRSAYTNREKYRGPSLVWQVFQLFSLSLSLCSQLRYIWHWLDQRVLQEWQFFHIICFLISVPRGRTKLWLLALQNKSDSEAKEAAKRPSYLKNLQQEGL